MERLLESHFARDMAFEGASVAAARPWLSPALHTLMTRYLAKPSSPDQVPAIDGDPFTDSQEYPTRFAVNAAVIRGATATVSVLFNDSAQRKAVVYVLTRIEGRWLVDDLRYGGALTVRRLLSGAP